MLVLVTLALVAFGLVMVYSATSAAAALGNGDPSYYLKRQGVYAVLGVAVLVVASRFDFRGLRALAPEVRVCGVAPGAVAVDPVDHLPVFCVDDGDPVLVFEGDIDLGPVR